MKEESVFQKKIVMLISAGLVCVVWSSFAPVTKLAFAELHIVNEFQRILFLGLRFSLAGASIIIFDGLYTKKSIFPQRGERPMILWTSLLTYVAFAIYAISLGRLNGVKSAVFSSTGVFFVPLISCLLMKGDMLDKKQWMGMLLGFLGVLSANFSVFTGEFTFLLLGDGFLLLHCAIMSVSMVLVRKYARDIDVIKLNGWQFFIGGTLLVVTGLLGYPEAFVMDAASIGLLLYLVAMTAVTFPVWFVMLKYYSASMLEQFKFVIPLVGSAISVVILPGEHLGPELLLAAALVAAGIIIVSREETQRRHSGAMSLHGAR